MRELNYSCIYIQIPFRTRRILTVWLGLACSLIVPYGWLDATHTLCYLYLFFGVYFAVHPFLAVEAVVLLVDDRSRGLLLDGRPRGESAVSYHSLLALHIYCTV